MQGITRKCFEHILHVFSAAFERIYRWELMSLSLRDGPYWLAGLCYAGNLESSVVLSVLLLKIIVYVTK